MCTNFANWKASLPMCREPGDLGRSSSSISSFECRQLLDSHLSLAAHGTCHWSPGAIPCLGSWIRSPDLPHICELFTTRVLQLIRWINPYQSTHIENLCTPKHSPNVNCLSAIALVSALEGKMTHQNCNGRSTYSWYN